MHKADTRKLLGKRSRKDQESVDFIMIMRKREQSTCVMPDDSQRSAHRCPTAAKATTMDSKDALTRTEIDMRPIWSFLREDLRTANHFTGPFTGL